MWPRVVWDLNITTLTVFVSGCIAFYLGVMRQRDTLKDAQRAIEHWKIQFLALKAEHDVFKEKVITEYVRRPELEKVVDKLFEKIDEQGKQTIDAINGIYQRLLDDAKTGGGKR